MEIIFKKMESEEEIKSFWEKKRQYENEDVFPNLEETGEELKEIVEWFESQEYYEIIMGLHNNPQSGGSRLQFVFFYDGYQEYLGFAMYKIYTQEDGKAFILDYCIDRPFRNKGIGSFVFERLEDLLHSEGGTYVALNVSNDNNRRFWLREGFEPIETNDYGEVVYIKR